MARIEGRGNTRMVEDEIRGVRRGRNSCHMGLCR